MHMTNVNKIFHDQRRLLPEYIEKGELKPVYNLYIDDKEEYTAWVFQATQIQQKLLVKKKNIEVSKLLFLQYY